MRLVIIGVVALLVLGGGGAAAYFFLLKKPAEAAVGEEDAEGAEDHAKKDEHKKEKGGHGGGSQFVELEPLILPIVDNEGVNQVVSLVVSLEVGSAEDAAQVEHMAPKLKDAYIQDMYGVLNRHAALKGGVVQVADIKKRLNKISNDIMGEDVVHDVLLQVVQQRPI
ncbi:MAG TPA: flagellar basal body-associated FliL family protein [Rhodospirillaceae bacterium]|nr:flagellar basal body-associated FliL family protein [Rhodospirillaceae bacterium]